MPYRLPDNREISPDRPFKLYNANLDDEIQHPPPRLMSQERRDALGLVWVAPPPPPPQPAPTKDQLYALSASHRWNLQNGGTTITLSADPLVQMPVRTDAETQRFLAAAWSKATADANYSIVDYKIGPGQYATLNAATIIALANGVEAFIQSCFTANKNVDVKIADDTYTTIADVTQAGEWPTP